jgi:hypothetical protein
MMRVPRRRIAAPAATRDAAERSLLARKAATTSAATASSLSDNPGDEIHGDLLTSLPEEGSPKAGSGASPRSVAKAIASFGGISTPKAIALSPYGQRAFGPPCLAGCSLFWDILLSNANRHACAAPAVSV